nr:DUF1564 family protein [Leptospira noguchii]
MKIFSIDRSACRITSYNVCYTSYYAGVWATLGVLAAAHGVSRCYLFNYMLWLEDLGGKVGFFCEKFEQGSS